MAELMEGIDLAITSNGRTIFELAAMGVPTISMAQNREKHFIYLHATQRSTILGMGHNISTDS